MVGGGAVTVKGRAGLTVSAVPAVLAVVALSVVLAALAVPVGAWPHEDGQAPWAGSRYSNNRAPGWMTTSADDRVYDIAQIGDTIYVAGTFRGIRNGSTRAGRAHLAAFDRRTGAPVWGFDPRFDGPVHTLAVADDGRRLYAGGAFSQVDGRQRRRLVALTPGGDVVGGWRADVGRGNVWALVATRTYLYVGGSFGRIGGASRTGLARLFRADGRVDRAWAPRANGGTVRALEMPPGRDRIYAGGRFRDVNGWGNTADLVALRTTDGRPITTFGHQPRRDVLDILADGRGRVWLALDGDGGAAALLDGRGRRLRFWRSDGDVQAVERIGSRVFFGGHELDGRMVATVDYDRPGAWDTRTFRPAIDGREGIWAFHADGRWLWVGGQVTRDVNGFARYPAR